MNEQEKFWIGNFGDIYREQNIVFDENLQSTAWKRMLNKILNDKIGSILECGSNIGRNLIILKQLLPNAKFSLIEINKNSYEIALKNVNPEHSFNGSIIQSNFKNNSFDLTFTCGVLIHIPPYDLHTNMDKIFHYSRKYILFCEYFARELEIKPYHGQINRLFKMDFGSYFIDNFDVELLDYGFLWGHEFDLGGFDDTTWWLFKKKKQTNRTRLRNKS